MRRCKSITYQTDPRAGFQGAFRQLLDHSPTIEKRLIVELTRRVRNHSHPNRLNFRGAHKLFVDICKEEGIPPNEYPFTTKAKGARALREWIKTVIVGQHGKRWLEFEEGSDAAQAYQFQSGDGAAKMVPAPYAAWQIDENTIDVEAVYELPNERGDWEEIALRRSFVIRVIDVGSGAKLANRLVLAPQASAEDVAILLWDAISGVEVDREARDAGSLNVGAAYPAAAIPELKFAVSRTIYLDNALAHLANHVQHLIAGLWGGEVMLGRPGTPQERANIEADFSAQATRLLHQLPGTTGTGPGDPHRRVSKNRLPVQQLAIAIDCYCANANALPAAAAGYIAPLERLRRSIVSGTLNPLYLPADKRRPHYFGKPYPVSVKMDLRTGRRPFVNFLYARYSSELLMRSVVLKDKRMWVRADFRDLRTVVLFDDAGNEFGVLQALGRWGQVPHDVRIRKLFGRLKREGELGPHPEDAPLECLLEYLKDRASRDRNAALQLAYVLEYLKKKVETDFMPIDRSHFMIESAANVPVIEDSKKSSHSALQSLPSLSATEIQQDDVGLPFISQRTPRYALKK
ncbi:hypothetical protein A8E62_00695 [Burkholderia cenocepacia]|nr:hypothetical protein A8E62_00695 [Burkholderia cenocepacia]